MARKKSINQEPIMTTSTASYETIFKKMDALQGVEKKKFSVTLTKEEKEAYIEYLRDRDCEKVTGIFRCFEPPGGMLEMNAKAYKGEESTKYVLVDGQECTIPRYMAKRFESEYQGIGTWYPTHSHILDSFGKPTVVTGKKNRRFGFSSMDFQ